MMRIGKIIAYFLWAVSLVIQSTFAADLPSAEEVRQRLKERRLDRVAFRIRYQSGDAEGQWGGKKFREFLMTDSHDYLDTEETFWPDKPPPKKVSGGNATARFIANYVSPDDGNSWQLVSLHELPRLNSGIGSALKVVPFSVMLDPISGLWMDEYYFSENNVRVTAREDVDGESCIVLDVTYMLDGKVDGNGSRLWLAENKDFMIKKLMPNDGPPTGRRDAEYLCTEFKMAGGKWYPSQGLLFLPPEQAFWRVIDFEVNPRIDAKLFIAPSRTGLVARLRQPEPGMPTEPNSTAIAEIPDATPRDNTVFLLGGLGTLICILGLGASWKLGRSR